MTFKDYATAARMRDVIRAIVREELERARPAYRYATVVTVDVGTYTCTVTYPGEAVPVTVRMDKTAQPTTPGEIVRIDGVAGDRFISAVMG